MSAEKSALHNIQKFVCQQNLIIICPENVLGHVNQFYIIDATSDKMCIMCAIK